MLSDTPINQTLLKLLAGLSLIGCLGLICASTYQLLWGFQSRHWLPTEAQVTWYHVQHNHKSVEAEVSYQYDVNGRIYTSHKFAFGNSVPIATPPPYEEGQHITAFYNPKDHAMAVLVPGPTRGAAALGFGGLFISAGWLFYFYLMRLLKTAQQPRQLR